MDNVCLKLQERKVLPNQIIEADNFFTDGDDGNFQNLDNISTDMNNIGIDDVLFLTGGASMTVEMDRFGTIVMEGDSNISLLPNREYFITAYIYQAIDPPVPNPVDYYIDLDITGWTDGIFTILERYQLTNENEGIWQKVSAKLVTNTDVNGKIKLVQSGTYVQFVDGETFHIDSVSISSAITYLGDTIQYGPQFTLPVDANIDATAIFKFRDLQKPEFFFQRERSRKISIPSTTEVEKYLGFAHDVGSIKGNKAFNQEYLGILEVDGIEILKGIFTFDELKTLNCKNKKYYGKLLSGNKEWVSRLQSQELCNIDWSEYKFSYTENNLENNWNQNGDTTDFITFLFEVREIPDVVGNIYSFFANEFGSGFFIKPFLRKIFRHIGYEIEFNGAFLKSNDFRDEVVTGVTVSSFLGIDKPDIIYYGYHLGEIIIREGETEVPDYEDSEFDPNSYINGNCVTKVANFDLIMNLHFEIWSGTIYTAPNGDVSFTLPDTSPYDGLNVCARAIFEFDTVAATTGDHVYWIKVEFYQGATIIDTQYVYDSQEPRWDTDGLTIVQTTDLGNGDWRIDYTGPGGAFSHFFGGSVMIGNGDQDSYTQLRQAADLKDVGPEYGQVAQCINLKDMVGSIFGLYNILAEEDKVTNVIHLWQRDDYYTRAEIIDTDGIVTKSEVSQKRLGKAKGKEYKFSYAKNETDIWYKEKAPENFGDDTYVNEIGNSGLDAVEMTTSNIFHASYDWEALVGLWVPRYQKPVDLTQGNLGPRILHYEGLKVIQNPGVLKISFIQDVGPIVSYTKQYITYPSATFASREGLGTVNLSYADYQGNQGLISKHFAIELELIANSMLLSVYFYLNVDFISKLKYYKYWKYKDSLFILNRIVDFRYMVKAPTKVELVPINTFYGTDT